MGYTRNYSGLPRSRRPSGLRKTSVNYNSLAHRTTWLRSDFMLGLFTFCIVQYQGIKNHGIGHFTGLFQPFPVLFPINLIGEITNPLSQALRLFGNMMSGVVIMGLWYGMMPIFLQIGIPSFLHVYCDLFSGCIQTYVFCMLTMVYVNDKMD